MQICHSYIIHSPGTRCADVYVCLYSLDCCQSDSREAYRADCACMMSRRRWEDGSIVFFGCTYAAYKYCSVVPGKNSPRVWGEWALRRLGWGDGFKVGGVCVQPHHNMVIMATQQLLSHNLGPGNRLQTRPSFAVRDFWALLYGRLLMSWPRVRCVIKLEMESG